MFSGFIFTSNNFRKPCLKRESSSTLLTQSKTHIQAHLSQAPASLDRATPRSKTHLQAYLQTISKKKKESNPRSQKEIRAGEIAHTTPHRITAPNPRSHRSHRTPTLARSHPATCEIEPTTCKIAPPKAPARSHRLKHQRDHTHDPLMPNLSLSQYTSPFPSIVVHSRPPSLSI